MTWVGGGGVGEAGALRPLGTGRPVAGGIDCDLPGDGVRLRATRWPPRSDALGTPVLLLHGLASQRRFWNLVVPGLAGLPVVALDQRGHGDSDRPRTGYDTDTVGRDVLTALDALGWSRTVLVGHSWGAVVALSVAADRPDRVIAAVAIDGGLAAPGGRGERASVRAALEPPRWALPPEQVAERLRTGPLRPWWSDEVKQAVLPIFGVGGDGLARARLPFERHMALVDALLDYDPAAVLPRIRCPAWLVSCEPGGGEREQAWAREKATGLDAAATLLQLPRLMRWTGALHDVPLQWPALVSGLIRAAAGDAVRGSSDPKENR